MTDSNDQSERRGSNRFPISRDVRYKIVGPQKEPEPGQGETVNMSSTGVLFTTEQELSPGRRVEMDISWPARLNDTCPLKLVAKGTVVRAEPGKAALEIQQYEFRTVGKPGLRGKPERSKPDS